MAYTFLNSSSADFSGIWAWAKKLVQDMNSRDVQLAALIPVGSGLVWPGATAPTGFVLADGASYAVLDKPSLFAVYGYTHGGSGDNFNVPTYDGLIATGVNVIIKF